MRCVRRAVDVALAALLVATCATPITEATAHEWIGVALVVLMLVHVGLNARRACRMARVRGARGRMWANLALDLVMLVLLLGMAASSLVLSRYAFGWLPVLPGVAWARPFHLCASYWLFVLCFVHFGLHLRAFAAAWRLSRGAKLACGAAAAACAVFGVYSFVELGVFQYMTLQTQFAFIDASVPVAIKLLQHAAMAVAVTGIAYGATLLAKKCAQQKGGGG